MGKNGLFLTILILVIFSSGCEKRSTVAVFSAEEQSAVATAKMVDHVSHPEVLVVTDHFDVDGATDSQKNYSRQIRSSEAEEAAAVSAFSSLEGFALKVSASEGGRARFLEGKEISKELPQNGYQLIAVADEGYYFDHWEVIKGKTISPLTMETLSVEAVEGVVAKASFVLADSLIYVSRERLGVSERRNGSRKEPFLSLDEAVDEALGRLEKKKVSSVEIRIAMGDYLLKDNGALELVPGIALVGGFNPKTWGKSSLSVIADKKAPPSLSQKNQTIIRIGKNFASEAMIFINAQPKEGFKWKKGEVSLSELVLDGSLCPVVLISATGVTPKISNCILKGYGESLVSCFDSGAEIYENQLLAYGKESIAVDINLVAHPGASILQNVIWMGSESHQIVKGLGIRVYSSDSNEVNRIRIAHNQIRSGATESFTGIQVDNGLLVCEGNRIETLSKTQQESFGMNLKGEAVVNSNLIMLESKGGYGLALTGNGYPARILNNTIVTKSPDSTVPMTACGNIDGKKLLISHNIFVNPQEEQAAALGVRVLGSENRIFNNYIISNNEEEKRLVVGFNGNQDQITDNHVKAAIYESGVEIDLEF